MRISRLFFISLLCAALAAPPPRPARLTPAEQALLDGVTAAALKAHVSFLASDALEGRDTPSKGLDAAAEYIASQFRRYGLEPAGNDGYFQTAGFGLVTQKRDGATLRIEGAKEFTLTGDKLNPSVLAAAEIPATPVVKITIGGAAPVDGAALAGKVVLATTPSMAGIGADERGRMIEAMMRDRATLMAASPALVASAGGFGMGMGGGGGARPRLTDLSENAPPSVTVTDEPFAGWVRTLPDGPVDARISATLPAPSIEKVNLKNVAGVVRGSDPKLKDTYILVSAHYDHVGVRSAGADRIMNGANDNASGTASMMALAEAFALSKVKPKRSVLFLALFGEEKGLFGSRYYGRHPLFPLAATVAGINLEQMGRADSTDGPQIKRVSPTGFDYSTVGESLKAAGERVGVTVYKDEKRSDTFFNRSDNQALADVGIPAHTLVVAFEYPDYHGAGDHWDKIDYANMEAVDRAVALAVWTIGNDPKPPAWNEGNEKARRYVEAAKKLK